LLLVIEDCGKGRSHDPKAFGDWDADMKCLEVAARLVLVGGYGVDEMESEAGWWPFNQSKLTVQKWPVK
jgi:hypothetical protein